jgi:hypothetical protein
LGQTGAAVLRQVDGVRIGVSALVLGVRVARFVSRASRRDHLF